ncbi:hypothetical protein ACGFYU_01555 [Streptomyces sp. NPDC048337]|uniref:hypothetical protein n=1 Tax=Streptomyces sp. NPDC048337 TaxID=3365535 RepID=UPI0037135A0D
MAQAGGVAPGEVLGAGQFDERRGALRVRRIQDGGGVRQVPYGIRVGVPFAGQVRSDPRPARGGGTVRGLRAGPAPVRRDTGRIGRVPGLLQRPRGGPVQGTGGGGRGPAEDLVAYQVVGEAVGPSGIRRPLRGEDPGLPGRFQRPCDAGLARLRRDRGEPIGVQPLAEHRRGPHDVALLGRQPGQQAGHDGAEAARVRAQCDDVQRQAACPPVRLRRVRLADAPCDFVPGEGRQAQRDRPVAPQVRERSGGRRGRRVADGAEDE